MASKRLRDAIGIDPDRVVSAALEAALGEVEAPRKKRHPGRVLAAGAALAAAATVGQRRMPKMARLPLRMGLNKLGDMTHVDELADALHDRADALHDRLVGHEDEPDEDFEEDEDAFDDEPADAVEEDLEDEDLDDDDDFDDEDFDDGPEDDGPEDDEGPDDGDDGEEPEAEAEEDLEDEPPEDEDPEDVDEEDLPAEDDDEEEDLPPEEEEEEAPPEEDDGKEVAARSVELGVSSGGVRGSALDQAPDLFEALRTRPRRRPPVMRRGSLGIDPATRPPEPSAGRHGDERRGSSRKSKPTTAHGA